MSEKRNRLNEWAEAIGIGRTTLTDAWNDTKRSHSHGTGSMPSRWPRHTASVPAWATTTTRGPGVVEPPERREPV